MKRIVITGEDRHIENVLKENQGRVNRGFITIQEYKPKAVKPDTKQAPKPDSKDVNPESK